MNVTLAKIRSALKKAGLAYDLEKTEGSWYVVGGDSCEWSIGRCTYCATLGCLTVEEWVQTVIDMVEDAKKNS